MEINNYINSANVLLPKTDVLFVDFIRDTVKRKSKRMKGSYGNNYKTLVYHLERFCNDRNAILYTNSINEMFLDDFIVFLEESNLKKMYIKNLLCLVKAMVKRAANYGYAVDLSYDDVTIDDEEIPSIYLSPNDIARIYYFKGLTKKQERVKDLFIVGCCTALRYSDLSTLVKEDFNNGYITKLTKKTGTRVVIPIHDFVKEIYDKYDGNISLNLSSQHFNRYIKLICKKVGLTENVNQTYTKGGNIVTISKERWELVSSHTGRRSGATNLMNTGRLRVSEIMNITGHLSEKSFMRYIKTSKEDNAKHMAGDNFFRK